jgi:uncharacterized protein (TIGR03435 family)
MKRQEQSLQEFLKVYLTRFRNLPPAQIESAGSRVLSNLKRQPEWESDVSWSGSSSVGAIGGSKRYFPRSTAVFSVAVAVAVSVVFASVVIVRNIVDRDAVYATVGTPDGSLNRASEGKTGVLRIGQRVEAGEVVVARADGATLALADGSSVEMRAQSELTLERAADGVRLRLSRGGVIVNAAKQDRRHLYVQTQDVTVSVVGTVFLVKAEETGSRVAVIEGEVQVRQGTTSKKLLPGEQVVTSPTMPRVELVQEISWSRNARAHVALLQASARPSSPPPTVQFEAAVVKPSDPRGPTMMKGGGCHGIDTRDPLLRNIPAGRCVIANVTLRDLIWIANPHLARSLSSNRVVVGGPDWSGIDEFDLEGKAEDLSQVTQDQLMQMLWAFLTEEFNLRSHYESRDISGYVLTEAKGGVRLKETPNGTGRGALRRQREGGVLSASGRDISIWYLAGFLSAQLGTPVLDQTNLMGGYDIEFSWASAEADGLAAAPSLFTALRELGLQLEAGKGPTEVLVIDHAEKPSGE